ncbi:MAG: hypothetical protein JWR16_2117 [Nevskia sp.]|nr:hypothetical protein [Nevskia sp.]
MKLKFAWRMLLTLLALLSMVPILIPNLFLTLPFSVEAKTGIGYVVDQIPGLPLAPGLQIGDVLLPERMDASARAAAIVVNNLPPHSTYPIVVRRGGEVLTVPVTAVVNDSRYATATRLSGYPLLFSVLALALLTLWRGRDWTAWGLTLFSLGICAQQLLDSWPVDPLIGFFGMLAAKVMVWGIAIPGLYVAVEALAGDGLSATWKRGLRTLFGCALLLTLAISLGKGIGIVFSAWTGWFAYQRLLTIPGTLMVLTPLVVLIVGYRRSDAPRRLRIRWVLWSTGLLGASVIAAVFIPDFSVPGHIAISAMQALCFFGYLYAALRHRLVDVSFIVDRALAYGLTTSVVIGVFAILENFIEQAAVGNDASFFLQAGATLVLALALNRVHHRVEAIVDRLFFRRQRRATHELRRFAQQCAFIEQHERLLSLTVECIEQAIGGSGVAIYERREGRYLQLIQRGSAPYPAAVEVDDLAFVSLRSTLQATDLDDITGSALGRDGCLLPMALRGVLIGAIVCGARRGEQFAPDERIELAKLAQEVGIALYVLRAREHERFVAAVASGAMRDPQQTARQLLPTLATYDSQLSPG